VRRHPLRAAAALAAALLAVPLLASPASAAGTLTPFVTCQVRDAVRGTTTYVLGYENTGDAPVTLTPGTADNFFNPGQRDRGQPDTFLPGRHPAAFTVGNVYAEVPKVFWILDGLIATADANPPECASVTTTTLSVPATATTGEPVTVVASVQSVVAVDPRTGTVDLAVDGAPVASAPLGAGGTTRFTLPALTAGTRTITASYVPDPASGQSGSDAAATVEVLDPGTLALGTATTTAGTAQLTVTRTSGTGTATVDWATADGTAEAGEDYTASAGTVTFTAGQTTATVTVPLAPRAPGAPEERFFVLLHRATAPVGTASAAVVLAPGPAAGGGGTGGGGTGGGGGAGGGGGGGTGAGAGGGAGGAAGEGAGSAGAGATAGAGARSSSAAGRAASLGLALTGAAPTALLASGTALLLVGGAAVAARRRRA